MFKVSFIKAIAVVLTVKGAIAPSSQQLTPSHRVADVIFEEFVLSVGRLSAA